MKQHTTPEQTAKLIKLGFEKPKGISDYYQRGPYEYDAETNTKMVVYDDTQYPIYAYSIGELLSFLPKEIDYNGFKNTLYIFVNQGVWVVEYSDFLGELYSTYRSELIDAIFDVCVKLKEEGVI